MAWVREKVSISPQFQALVEGRMAELVETKAWTVGQDAT